MGSRARLEEEVGEILAEYGKLVDAEIRRAIDARGKVGDLYDMMRYHLGWTDRTFRESTEGRGKRFRPAMLLLTCEALGGDRERALPAAAAVELVHNFSLIHDDIEDGDRHRRGRETLWSVWGLAQGINTGDGMHALVNLAALHLAHRGVDAATVVRVLRVLDGAVMELCEGQYLDLVNEERSDVTAGEYLEVIARKTSALVAASTECGAILAGKDEATAGRLGRFGRTLGLAFQIRDDILGVFHPEKLGKEGSSDIRRKKRNLPVLYALERSPKADQLRELYAKAALTDRHVEEVLAILREAKADEYCMQEAERHEKEAFAILEGLGVKNAAYEKLLKVSRFLVWRER